MNAKLFNISLIKYELRNITGNIFTIIFGVFFPIMMTAGLSPIFMKSVPENFKSTAFTAFFIGASTIIPLASVFIGYSAVFSQEVEHKIPIRFKLFGYKESTLVASKLIANLIFITLSIILYVVVNYSILDLEKPNFSSAIILITSIYLLNIFLFIFAHGISLIFKKFAPTNALTMMLYFGIMILSGLFGATPNDFPQALKYISYLLPTTYISQDFINFWNGGSYNFGPFIQSFILFGVVSCLVLFFAIQKNSREK